jgi:hypothetical protein
MAGVLAGTIAALAATPALATPTCPGTDRSSCGGRIIPEPAQSAGFLTYAEWIGAMQQLQKEHPDRVRFDNVGKTFAGRPLYAVTVTDFADKTPMRERTGLYFNGDIHGDERDGTEGFARVVEDLAESKDAKVAEQLRHEVLVFTDVNPDGWQPGDVPDGASQPGPSGPQYTRENGAGHDLNREWPVVGFQNPTTNPFEDPEVHSIVQAHGNVLHRTDGVHFAYGFDVHGSAGAETPPNAQLMLDMLLSAGQLSMTRALEQVQWADGYIKKLEATSNDNALATVTTSTGQQIYRVGDWDTSWDIYGYLVSGGFADWMGETTTGLGADVAATIELFVNGEPGQENTFAGYDQPTEAANVHAMRVVVTEAMDLAASPQHGELRLAGPVGWIPNRTTVSPSAGPGSTKPVGDDATRPPARTKPASTDDFFTDLPATGAALTKLTGTTGLSGERVVVMAQDAHLDDPALLAALKSYVQGGGTLVLTDGALQALAPLGVLPAAAITVKKEYAGYFDHPNDADPLVKGARSLSRQTYEPVPIGYKIDNSFSSATSTNTSPVWTVDQTAWEKAGGRTAGTTESGRTSLGEVPLGAGKVRILGALLPDASTEFDHPFGLASYAVTYWGYQVFANLIDSTEALAPGAPPQAPAAKACASKRTVAFRVPRGWRRVKVYVAGRLARAVHARRGRVRVRLVGRPRGAVSVRAVGITRAGRRSAVRHTYHPCVHGIH